MSIGCHISSKDLEKVQSALDEAGVDWFFWDPSQLCSGADKIQIECDTKEHMEKFKDVTQPFMEVYRNVN